MATTLSRVAMPPLRPTAALLATLLCMPLATQAQGQPQPLSQAQSRGELLYSTYCAECHSSQMHWREKKTVRDWPSLRAQVAFWQAQAQLGWGEEDITAVARYLNARYYRLPPDAKTAAALPGGPATATLLASRYRPPAP